MTTPASTLPQTDRSAQFVARGICIDQAKALLSLSIAINSRLSGVWLSSTAPSFISVTLALRAKPSSNNCSVGGRIRDNARRRSRRIWPNSLPIKACQPVIENRSHGLMPSVACGASCAT